MINSELLALVREKVKGNMDKVVAFRHLCHKFPERTWQEEETAKKILSALTEIPELKVQSEVGKYGVVATLEGKSQTPVVGLRADMDALPLNERNSLPYCSSNVGTMHACGHDGHMANLFGAALVLSELKDHLPGTVKFIFQPAEEGGAGARVMCEEGALENPRVDVMFGMHGWPEAPCGHIWFKAGPILAANSQVKIVIEGTGCHSAMPHLGTDQVLVAARLIDQLQSISSRSMAPTDPVALTFTKIAAGEATNIIPRTVTIEGTLRTVAEDVTEKACRKIERMVFGICEAHGVKGSLEFQKVYPPTVNHKDPTDFLCQVAQDIFDPGTVKQIDHPSMGAEDFSFYLQRVPGSFFFLGLDDGRTGGFPSLHHPEFDFNDKALIQGMELFSCLALASHR